MTTLHVQRKRKYNFVATLKEQNDSEEDVSEKG